MLRKGAWWLAAALLVCAHTLSMQAQTRFNLRRDRLPAGTRWVQVDSITVSGNKKTKAFAITREMTFQVGDSLPEPLLDSILNWNQRLVYNLSLFNVVDFRPQVENRRLRLHIAVKERFFYLPEGSFYIEDQTIIDWFRNPQWRRVTLSGGGQLQNLTGRNDGLYLNGSIGNTLGMMLRYRRPFLFPRARLDATFGLIVYQTFEVSYGAEEGRVQRLRYKLSPLQRQFEGEFLLTRRFTQFHRLTFGVGYRYWQIADTLRLLAPEYLTTGTCVDHYPHFTVRFDVDRRNLRAFPTRGFRVLGGVQHFGLPGLGTALFAKFYGTFTYYSELGTSRWGMALGAIAATLVGRRVPFNEMFTFNRDFPLRGYEQYYIQGSTLVMLKSEVRFAAVRRHMVSIRWLPRKFRDFPVGLYLYGWLDGGYINDFTRRFPDRRFHHQGLHAVGLGLIAPLIYDTVVRFEVGRNHLGQFSYQLNFTLALQ